MKNNLFYEALIEGRFQIPIQTLQLEDESYESSYVDVNGQTITVQDYNRSEAHRRCTDKVMEGVRNGEIVPFF
jgi:hypothetical protein